MEGADNEWEERESSLEASSISEEEELPAQ